MNFNYGERRIKVFLCNKFGIIILGESMKKDNWILTIFLITFVLSVVFSTLSNVITMKANNVVLGILLICVIILGILFDMIGTSAISGDEATFHALNSKKKKEGPIGLFIVKNGSKISSVCNDVVGDVSGIISGSIGAVLAISISSTFGFSQTLVSIVIAAIISSFTVGGKAIFKPIAVNNANNIIIRIAKIFSIFKRGK